MNFKPEATQQQAEQMNRGFALSGSKLPGMRKTADELIGIMEVVEIIEGERYGVFGVAGKTFVHGVNDGLDH